MFRLFKKKSQFETLELIHAKLLEEAYQLSTTNRRLSDLKTAEANAVLKEIEELAKKD